MKVLVLLSEILSSKTLLPIVEELIKGDQTLKVLCFNDGFCSEYVQSLNLEVVYVTQKLELWLEEQMSTTSLVLTGKTYVQPTEHILLHAAHRHRVPVLMVIPDMGIDVVRQKLLLIGKETPRPLLLLADSRTRNSLLRDKWKPTELFSLGNPYFDELYGNLEESRNDWNPVGVGYFSTPFELDFMRGILPADYKQSALIDDIRTICKSLDTPLLAKRHPQLEAQLFDGIEQFVGTPFDMFKQIRIAVGSYSTTLLEAYVAGIPTFSYQPWEKSIREDVFKDRIPIYKTTVELTEAIYSALTKRQFQSDQRKITFNPGTSLQVAVDLIRSRLLKSGSRLNQVNRSSTLLM